MTTQIDRFKLLKSFLPLLSDLGHFGRGGHFSDINCRVKHFFQFIFVSFSALLNNLAELILFLSKLVRVSEGAL